MRSLNKSTALNLPGRTEMELQIRNQIKRIFLTIPDDQMYSEVLDVILIALNSKFGIFGYYDDNGTFIIPEKTRTHYWRKCRVPEKSSTFKEKNFGDIWYMAIKTKKTVCSNTESFHLPEGHIHIFNTIVTPIVYQEKVLSAIQIANKPSGYNENDRNLLEVIADHIAPVLHARLERDKKDRERAVAEESLRKAHDRLENTVKERTNKLIKTNLELIEEIRERKIIENDLRANEEKLRIIADYTYAWEYWIAPDFKFMYISPSCERITGYKPAEFVKKPALLEKIIHPEDKIIFRNHSEFSFDKVKPETIDFKIISRDGTVKWINHICHLIYSPDGEFLGKRASNRDITEQVNAGITLSKSEERYRTIFESSGNLMLIVNRDYDIMLVNNKFAEFAGLPKSKIENKKNLLDFLPAAKTQKILHFKDKLQKTKIEKPLIFRTSLINKNGRLIEVYLNANSLPDTDQYLLSMNDITKTVELEKELLDISMKEQQRIGHDLHDNLGQHLTGVAFLSKLLTNNLKKKSPEYAEEAENIVDQINGAINQIRAFSKGLSPVDLKSSTLEHILIDFAQNVERIFDIRCIVKYDRNIKIEDSLKATHLFYIIQEAVNNSIKHGKAKNVLISFVKKNKILTLEINDDGIGIPGNYSRKNGIGIKIMHYRAHILNAILEIKRNTKKGTSITCTLNFDELQNKHSRN